MGTRKSAHWYEKRQKRDGKGCVFGNRDSNVCRKKGCESIEGGYGTP